MIKSMTAFARGQIQLDKTHFFWEIKSVNHRYLDISFRLPEPWRFLENDLRMLLKGKISRGKLECQLKQQDEAVVQQLPIINEPLVDAMLAASMKLSKKTQLQNDLSLSTLLTWPGVVTMQTLDVEPWVQPILHSFEVAIEQLQHLRSVEGQSLEGYLIDKLLQLENEILNAKKIAVVSSVQMRDKLLTKFNQLKIELDNVRLEQEIALLLTKLDVTEELDRLSLHCKEVARTLKTIPNSGRRLDFLMQELNREANTLASKSDSILLTQYSVEMKVLIEQMREQIQNIE
jgi:uncharacterized protein (TIGR00255 family)